VFLVEHRCPTCLQSEVTPFVGVVEGDAGIWCCDNCHRAFRVRIEFEQISEKEIAAAFRSRDKAKTSKRRRLDPEGMGALSGMSKLEREKKSKCRNEPR